MPAGGGPGLVSFGKPPVPILLSEEAGESRLPPTAVGLLGPLPRVVLLKELLFFFVNFRLFNSITSQQGVPWQSSVQDCALPLPGALVQSLVREQRPRMPRSVTRPPKKISVNSIVCILYSLLKALQCVHLAQVKHQASHQSV